MYFQNIESIDGVSFTPREVDVISCILNVRGVKKIAVILSISPRTVEGHIQNILLKISANSQETIKDFVEKSDELLRIKQHYLDLMITSFFEQQIYKLSRLFSRAKITCIVNYQKNDVLDYIIKYLKLANVEVVLNNNSAAVNTDNKNTLLIMSQEQILKLQQQQNFFNLIFICVDEQLNYSVLQEFSDINLIDCTKKEKIHTAIFKILEILAPDIDFNDTIFKFNKLRSNITTLKIDISSEVLINLEESKQGDSPSHRTSYSTVLINNKNLLYLICICAIIIVFIFLIVKNNSDNLNTETIAISYNFSLPNKDILLKRPMINAKIDKIFNTEDAIQTTVLVGVGGAGKTTIARQYAIDQNLPVIWEINAETKNSLMSSIEQLAYVLCSTIAERQELNILLEIKKIEQKEEQLLLLVQRKLKEKSNWLLIYDNYDNMEIFKYFPHNSKAWGNGRVIITTRDTNIRNNNYIASGNMIYIDELTKEEKLQLFLSIIGDTENNSEKDVNEFLEQIPSFPLDVSVAAYYLKETAMKYSEYLKHITEPNEEFSVLQEKVLKNTNEYSKTRYSIITLSVKRIIDINPAFKELLLFISLLDSQEIPMELLIAYKNPAIVGSFISELKKNSFITNISSGSINSKDDTFSIHRGTQLVTLAYLTSSVNLNNEQNLLKPIINAIEHYISSLVEAEDTLKLQALQNHCEALLKHGYNILDNEAKTIIETALGVIAYYLGHDLKAKQMLEANLKNLDQYNHVDGIEVAWALLHLGAVYRKLGTDYTKARELLTQSVAIYRKKSPNNIGVAMALTHLGNVYRTVGNFEQAKIALQDSIKIYQKHPENYAGAAKALAYLGVVYREQSDYEKAKDLLEQSIAIYDKHHYPKYSSVFAGTLAHLGIVYRMIGEYESAKDLLQKSLDIYKQIRPANHPDIGRNVLNLGIIYGELGDYTQAKNLLHQSLVDYEKNYGKEHIETGKVLNHLGRVYIIGHDFNTAEVIINRALMILRNNSHPESYRSLELLGDIYFKKSTDELVDSKNMQKSQLFREQSIDYFTQALHVARQYFAEVSINVSRVKLKIKDASKAQD